MKILLLLFLFIVLTDSKGFAQKEVRIKKSINEHWKFSKTDSKEASEVDFDDSEWEIINIPHTWNNIDATDEISGYDRRPCWYRKNVFINQASEDKNSRIYIYFEGANQITDVYVNGYKVGNHKGGYTGFSFDLTSFIKYGKENLIALKVDNSHNPDIPPLSADFTFFGGVYRDVYLVQLNDVHFCMDDFGSSGIYINTPVVSKESVCVKVNCLISNKSTRPKDIQVEHRVFDKQHRLVAESLKELKLEEKDTFNSLDVELSVSKPQLWSPKNPYLYQVVSQIRDLKKGVILDEYVSPLGLRWFNFDPDEGFSLNGKQLKLIGTNRHQDYFLKGNALTDEFHVRDIRLLKEMGGNFLRIAHYPQDPTVLQMCDRLGILTSVEIPIVNAITESEEFSMNCKVMVEEMIKQNYNHPSVIIWAYMNETLLRPPFDPKGEQQRYLQYTSNLEKLTLGIENHIRRLDPDRYTMIACHGAISKYMDSGITDIPMILGWNLYDGWYGGKLAGFESNLEKLHALFPNQPLIITEYGADVHNCLHSFDSERFDYTVEYGNRYHEHYLKQILKRQYIAGANIWNLNDFYSEVRGYAKPRTNLKGITTLNREKKDTWWLYKAHLSTEPVIHFGQSEWKIRGGVADEGKNYCTQNVSVYSNGDSVSLQHNGEKYKAKVIDHIAHFSIPFVNGINHLNAENVINSKVFATPLTVEFRMMPNKFVEFSDEFFELNVMLGSKRIYEDRVRGQVWIPEQEYSPASWGYLGGESFRVKTKFGQLPCSEIDILGTDDDPIYQTQRVGIEEFRLDVPPGKYAVTLKWAELESDVKHEALPYNLGNDKIENNITERIFNVKINKNYIEKDLNLTSLYGAERAVSKKYVVEIVDDNGIQIQFEKVKGQPVLNALQVFKIL